MVSIHILCSFFYHVSVVFLFIFRGLSYIEKICNLCVIQVADFFLWVFKNDFSVETFKFLRQKFSTFKKLLSTLYHICKTHPISEVTLKILPWIL